MKETLYMIIFWSLIILAGLGMFAIFIIITIGIHETNHVADIADNLHCDREQLKELYYHYLDEKCLYADCADKVLEKIKDCNVLDGGSIQ